MFWDYACFDDPANTKIPTLRASYEQRYKKPLSTAVISGYEMMGMIGASLKALAAEKKPLDRAGLNEKLNAITFDGIGTRYTFSSEWHNGPRLNDIPVCTYQSGKRGSFKP